MAYRLKASSCNPLTNCECPSGPKVGIDYNYTFRNHPLLNIICKDCTLGARTILNVLSKFKAICVLLRSVMITSFTESQWVEQESVMLIIQRLYVVQGWRKCFLPQNSVKLKISLHIPFTLMWRFFFQFFLSFPFPKSSAPCSCTLSRPDFLFCNFHQTKLNTLSHELKKILMTPLFVIWNFNFDIIFVDSIKLFFSS